MKMIQLTDIQIFLSVISGILVGFSLGLIGGGGSILAIPLLIYFVGFHHPHMAIGTTAIAVGVNAYLNVIPHAMKRHVNFRDGTIFSIPGIAGTLIGAQLGLVTPGKDLLFIFAILMIAIAIYMLRRKCVDIASGKTLPHGGVSKIVLIGFLVGLSSGYFGIGGGFLIVPGLIYSAGLDIIHAVGTSLISVGTFGVVTALRYALSGDLNVLISVLFIAGGVLGGFGGSHLASAVPKRRLTQIFAVIIIIVAIYMMYANLSVLSFT